MEIRRCVLGCGSQVIRGFDRELGMRRWGRFSAGVYPSENTCMDGMSGQGSCVSDGGLVYKTAFLLFATLLLVGNEVW